MGCDVWLEVEEEEEEETARGLLKQGGGGGGGGGWVPGVHGRREVGEPGLDGVVVVGGEGWVGG